MDSPIDLSKLESLVKSLNDSLDVVGTRLALATAAVVIGLVIEYEGDVRKVFWAVVDGARHRNLAAFWSLDNHVRRAVLGGVFITVGVGAELWYEYRTSAIGSQLQSANGQIVALLNEKAKESERATQALKTEAVSAHKEAESFRAQIADADARTKSAEAKVASAWRDAANAQLMAKNADLARAELEARIAPRTLDATQREAMGSTSREFGTAFFARQVRLEWQAIDIEATIFGVEIKDALSRAGIQSDGPTAGLTIGVR